MSTRDPMTKNLAAETISSLGGTVDVFQNRLKKQLQEQEQIDGQNSKARDVRHSLMLQAMTTIRKALQEASKLNLGNRFHLELETSDWEGWPRLELLLIDRLSPEEAEHALVVSAHDRHESGSVNMVSKLDSSVLGSISLLEQKDFQHLPIVLKRALRRFLDLITPYIVKPVAAEEKLSQRPIKMEEEIDTVGSKLKNQDVFVDESYIDDSNRVAIDHSQPEMMMLEPMMAAEVK